jgi:hypothetical protein
MDPVFPSLDYDDDLRDLYVQAATRLTCSAIKSQMIQSGGNVEETAENVLLFFEIAFRRIQEVAEEGDFLDDDFLDEKTENGDAEHN